MINKVETSGNNVTIHLKDGVILSVNAWENYIHLSFIGIDLPLEASNFHHHRGKPESPVMKFNMNVFDISYIPHKET